MLLKAGVDISRLRPEIRKKLNVIEEIMETRGYPLVITSTYEGTHSASSLHYANLAVDIRLPDIRTYDYVEALRKKLGHDYDVVAESDHIHIEYDPKSI
ncbi:MAG: hypothetical protein DRJ03_19730 [Chloroflexi bacterium]|nr:MAG: hypothetical protein DRJ03_19730 [Chloroflexota bacterium]